MERLKSSRLVVFLVLLLVALAIFFYYRSRGSENEATISTNSSVPTAIPTLQGVPTGQSNPTDGASGNLPEALLGTPAPQFYGCRNNVAVDTVHPDGWQDDYKRVTCRVDPCAWVYSSGGVDSSLGCGFGTPFPNAEAFK